MWDERWFAWLDDEIAELPFLDRATRVAVRRALAADPVAFAVLYFSKHLSDRDGNLTFSEVHFEWARIAQSWATKPEQPQENRHAIIAPRECGKSTWWFLILPLWAASQGHSRFTAAFAHASAQAEGHLATLKHELETNPLLREDYPTLCEPARRQRGATLADRAGQYRTRSGWTFAARGIDTAVLGMKVDDARPDTLIMDDIEPDEANYSPLTMEKRLGTVTDAILPLNVYANVIMVGTVTMPGSIMHQHVKAAAGVETAEWIADEGFKPHHYRPFIVNPDGTERSIWPSKWPLSWLQQQRHTRSFAKNFENDPMAREGVYWLKEDFMFGEPELGRPTRTVVFVDPAVTVKKTSDYTGLAVISFYPELRRKTVHNLSGKGELLAESRVVIRYSAQVKLSGAHLKDHVTGVLMVRFPEIRTIVVESNQGGDLWKDVFAGIPNVRVRQISSTESKEVRFAEGLEYWQRRRVWHAEQFPTLQEQAVGFPRHTHDDVIDAAVTGVRWFLNPKIVKAVEKAESYVA